MKDKKCKLIYRPKLNEKDIIKRSIFGLILDILILTIIYNAFKFNLIKSYLYIHLFILIFVYIKIAIKYFLIFIKHRLDILIVTTNKELQDDLFKSNDLMKDIAENSIREFLLCIEFILISILVVYSINLYLNLLYSLNHLRDILIVHFLLLLLVDVINYRMEIKFKKIEDIHNILMFLSSGDKIK